MIRLLLFLSLVSTHIPGLAPEPYEVKGWREVVVSVSDLDRWLDFYTQVAGYETIHQGAVSQERMAFWALPEIRADELVLRNPGTERGYIRLIRFKNVAQQQIRESGLAWDTGGWFDFNVRVADMDVKAGQMLARGWAGYSRPVQFGFGPFEVKEWLARGPDGVVLALIQRLKPPLEGWPHLKQFSRPFNATQVVADMPAARRFYQNQLGFATYLEHRGASKKEGATVLGLPHNLADEIEREVYILHPAGTNEGSIELLSFHGATGYDCSARAIAPNLGILSLRFPVRNMPAFRSQIKENGIPVGKTPVTLELPPYGRISIFSITGPENARLTFFEQGR